MRTELLERERELSAIDVALAAAASGEGGALALEGKAGLGKTRLLAEARRRAAETGVTVLSARATELERDFPFAVMRQLLDPHLSQLSAVDRESIFEGAGAARGALGAGKGKERSPDSFSVLHALYWVVAGMSERTPLLLAIDDAHLADPGSLDWLAFMLPRLDELPVLVVLASRTDEADNPKLAQILADTSVHHLLPAALSNAATTALIERALTQQLDPPFAAACHEVTGGNPFLVTQLGRELVEQGIQPRAEQVEAARVLAPQRVAQTVLARISRLSPEAETLARAVAVLGDGVEQALADDLAGIGSEGGQRAADSLRRAAILDPGEALRFIHPLVRNAVYSDLAAGERGRKHAAAAELLRSRGAPPEKVASQLLASEVRGDRAAAETLLESGRRSLADGAPRSAVSYLMRALREPPPADLRREVLRGLLAAGIRTADHEALAAVEPEICLELERDPASARDLAAPLTMGMVLRGHFQEAATMLEAAVRTAVDEGDVGTAFQLEAQMRTLAVIIPGLREIDLLHYTNLVDPDSPAGRLAAAIEARAAVVDGNAQDAAEAAKRALGNDCSIFEEEPEIASATTVVLILQAADEVDAAGWAAERALEIARQRGAIPELARAWLLSGLGAWTRGDLVAAEGDVRQAIELTRLGEIAPLGLICSGSLAEILIERDELGAAEAILEKAGTASGPTPPNALFSLLLFARARLRFERGDFEAAVEDFIALGDQGQNLGFGPGPAIMGTPYAAKALVALERRPEAQELVESSLTYARRWGAPATIAHVLRGVATVRGGAEEIQALQEAVAILDHSPRGIQRADALVQLGATLRRRNRRAEARVPLREGLKLARRCGYLRTARLAQQELQATGETVRRYAPIGVESLTPSERRVAEMAASGMTNRQIAQSLFVTLKTVEAHLSATYDKLDIGSRRELPKALSQIEA